MTVPLRDLLKRAMGVKEPYPGVIVFNLEDTQVVGLIGLLSESRVQKRKPEPPNSMNKYGLTLDGSRWRRVLAWYQEVFVARATVDYYPEIRPLLKNPYAFAVDYEIGKQKSLATHYDSSAVTLICLGNKWKGGELVFYDGKKKFEIKHKVGQAIIHRGSHLHRAKPITSGSRTNLILWCQQRKAK